MGQSNCYRVCFVCTGNACRSPFAECVTRTLVEREGIKNIEVCSVGTLDWGKNPRDGGMCHVARQLGYALSGETTYMTRDLLESADIIIVFEGYHRNEITRVLDYSQWNKIALFNQLAFGENHDLEDPHNRSETVYRRVALQIEEGCRHLLSQWTKSDTFVE